MYKLVRASEAFDCDPYLFGVAIRLGERYGRIQLAGLDGFGELVPADNARCWAAALHEVLDDIPNENTHSSWPPTEHTAHFARHDLDSLTEMMRLCSVPWPEVLSGEPKKWLNEFIVFLDKGELRVWMDVIWEIEQRT